MFKIVCVILVATLSLKGDYLASELAEEEEAKLPPFVRKMLAANRLKLTDTLAVEYEATPNSTDSTSMVLPPILATTYPILAPKVPAPTPACSALTDTICILALWNSATLLPRLLGWQWLHCYFQVKYIIFIKISANLNDRRTLWRFL